jgi:hypothetical protein
MMCDEDFYSDLPDDNELAFLRLENRFRRQLREKTEQKGQIAPDLYLEYINKVHAAVRALDLPILAQFKSPALGQAVNGYSEISPEIENFIIQVKIRNGRRTKGYSVALDATTKEKIRHLIGQIRSMVDKLDVDIRKKEAFYARINALSDEIDRDRTKYGAYAALLIEMSNTAGKVARNLNPARKLLNNIGRLFGLAQDLESSEPQLRLEAPRRRLPPPNDAGAGTSDAETEPSVPWVRTR